MVEHTIGGPIVTAITPFREDFTVDFEGFQRNIDAYVQAELGAIIVCGSSGEFPTLEPREREAIFAKCVEWIDGRCPLIACTITHSTAVAIQLARAAEASGAQAILVGPPYFGKFTPSEIHTHIARIAASVSLPVVVLNYPEATGANLDAKMLTRLARDVSNIRYVDEVSGRLGKVSELREEGDAAPQVLWAGTFGFLEATMLGAVGWITHDANIVPRKIALLYRLVSQQQFREAERAYAELVRLFLFVEGWQAIQRVKAGVTLMGRSAGPVRPPLDALSADQREELSRILRSIE